jgi:hypothetical protein
MTACSPVVVLVDDDIIVRVGRVSARMRLHCF